MMYGRIFRNRSSAAFRSSFLVLSLGLPRKCNAAGIISVGASRKLTPQLLSFSMFSGLNTTSHDSILSTPSAALTFSGL
ncbi:hypothetical protein D3C80_1817250 [compost metagenome]